MTMNMIAQSTIQESQVGKKLTDFSSRKVIMIILFMLFTNPFFQTQTYISEPDSFDYGLNLLVKLNPKDYKSKKRIVDQIVTM